MLKKLNIRTLEQYVEALTNGKIRPKQDIYTVNDLFAEYKQYKEQQKWSKEQSNTNGRKSISAPLAD